MNSAVRKCLGTALAGVGPLACAAGIWVDPGVGVTNVYNQAQAEAAGFAQASLVLASGGTTLDNVTMDIADIQVGTNDTQHATALTLAGGAVNVTGVARVGARYGTGYAEGALFVTGGQHTFASGNIADLPGSKARLVIDGDDATKLTIGASESSYVWLTRWGTLNAEIRHGTLYSPVSIHIASRDWNSTGAVGDGRFALYDGGTLCSAKSIFFGSMENNSTGHAEVDVYGGLVKASHIALAYGNNPSGGTCCFRQYGGTVEVTATTGDYAGIHLPETNYRTAEYHLLGGVAKARQIYHNTSGSTAVFTADGGTFQPNSATTEEGKEALRGLSTAALGAKGLTLDTRTYATRINQPFTDLAGAEGCGLLVKRGTSALTVGNAATAHAKTVVAEGSIVFAAADTVWTSLVVTNGATLSTAGNCATLSFTALQLGDGVSGVTLALDSTDAIAVSGSCSVSGGVAVAFSDAPGKGTYPVLTCRGDVTALTRFNWRVAHVTGLAADCHAKGACAYDAEKDVTTFSIAVLTDAEEPAAEDLVVSEGAVTSVGDLDLGPTKRVIDVATDAELTVTGSAVPSGFVKRGGGRLLFTGEWNCFNLGFDLAGGLLGFSPMTATGRGTPGTFTHAGGTLQLSDPAEEAVFPLTYQMSAPENNRALVVKTDSNVTMTSLGTASGSGVLATKGTLVKRGAGRLTLVATAAEQVLGRYGGDATGNFTSRTVFDANGTAPTNGFRHLQVAEGDLRLTAQDGCSFLASGGQNFGIGMNTPNGTASPSLTVDGCLLNMPSGNSRYLIVGEFADADAFWSDAYLNVTNGATLNVDTLFGPNDDVEKNVTAHVNVVGGSVLHATYAIDMGYQDPNRARAHNLKKRAEYSVREGSRLSAASWFNVGGPTYVTLDGGSILAGGANHEPAKISLQWDRNPCGEFRFQGHSTLCMTTNFTFFAGVDGTTFNFVFDDGVWETGTEAEQLLAFQNVRYWGMKVLDGGLEMPVGAGRTVTLARYLSGTGALVKSGAGTLVLHTNLYNGQDEETGKGKQTLRCTGGLRVKEGALVLKAEAATNGIPAVVDAGATLDLDGSTQDFASVGGSGVVTNGTFARLTLKADAAPTLADVSYDTCTVDFGRTADDPLTWPYPKNVTVATLTGTTPRTVGAWRTAHTGASGVRGTFRMEGDAVKMTVSHTGFSVIVR